MQKCSRAKKSFLQQCSKSIFFIKCETSKSKGKGVSVLQVRCKSNTNDMCLAALLF